MAHHWTNFEKEVGFKLGLEPKTLEAFPKLSQSCTIRPTKLVKPLAEHLKIRKRKGRCEK